MLDRITSSKQQTILIVDDNQTNLHFLQGILKGDYKIYAAPSGEKALTFLENQIPDLILLDVEMPDMNGYEMLSQLKNSYLWEHIPVIFLTAQEGRDKEHLAFRMGAVDYILKPISASVVKSRVRLHVELEQYKKNLEYMVEQQTAQLLRTQDSILEMLSNVTAFRDNETGAHIKRTTFFVELLVRELIAQKHPDYQITEEYAQNIIKSSKLHDIGKVGVPDSILLKPAKLTPMEFDLIKKHTTLGAEILDDAISDLGESSSSFLNVAREIVFCHHEKWNGSGYPQGLRRDVIPISARVMAIADVYDALISHRPYKKPMSHEESMKIIEDSAGSHFDPNIIGLCYEVFDKFPMISNRYKDEHYRVRMLY